MAVSFWKGKKLSEETKKRMSESHKGKNTWSKDIKGEKHHRWKGDSVTYRTLHKWVERNLGKPRFCEMCGNRELKHRQYHWSNVSKKYKRVLSDWQRLCAKCHKKYDKSHA